MLTCKRLNDLSAPVAYRCIVCYAPMDCSRLFSNIELPFRTFLRSPEKATHVHELVLDNTTPHFRCHKADLFACLIDAFLDKKDQTDAYAYLYKYSDLPIWREYPIGQMLHEGVWSWRGLPHPDTINNPPIMSFRKFLITQFFEGRHDVIIWALLGFLSNLEDVEIRDWRTISTQAGRDLDPMQWLEKCSMKTETQMPFIASFVAHSTAS